MWTWWLFAFVFAYLLVGTASWSGLYDLLWLWWYNPPVQGMYDIHLRPAIKTFDDLVHLQQAGVTAWLDCDMNLPKGAPWNVAWACATGGNVAVVHNRLERDNSRFAIRCVRLVSARAVLWRRRDLVYEAWRDNKPLTYHGELYGYAMAWRRGDVFLWESTAVDAPALRA